MAKKLNFKSLSERAMHAGGLVVGVAASKYVGKALSSKIANPKVNALVRIGIGALLPSIAGHGKKEGFINDMSNGILADGATALAGSFGFPGLSGIDGIGAEHDAISYVTQEDLMNGVPTNDSISGND